MLRHENTVDLGCRAVCQQARAEVVSLEKVEDGFELFLLGVQLFVKVDVVPQLVVEFDTNRQVLALVDILLGGEEWCILFTNKDGTVHVPERR